MQRSRKFSTKILLSLFATAAFIFPGAPASAVDSPPSHGDAIVQPLNATGCTWAPGNLAATHCLFVNGRGVIVQFANSTYAAPDVNICSPTAQFQYTRPSGTRTTTTRSGTGCTPVSRYVTLDFAPNNREMANNSTFCARQRNSATSQEFSVWACVNIFK